MYTCCNDQRRLLSTPQDYEELVPNSYNHSMYWDNVAPLVFPWTFKPGYQLPIRIRAHEWLGPLNYLDPNVSLHGPSPLLFASFYEYFGAVGADFGKLWTAVLPFLRTDRIITEIGQVHTLLSIHWGLIELTLRLAMRGVPKGALRTHSA